MLRFCRPSIWYKSVAKVVNFCMNGLNFDREADSPVLTIQIQERPMEARVNQSITEWETEESELEGMFPTGIQSHLDKVSWKTMAMVGGGMVGLVFFVIGGKLIIMALQYSK